MLMSQEKVDLPFAPVWITPKSATRATPSHRPLSPSGSEQACVMLVDDPHPFREQTAAELIDADLRVVQASGVYEALRLARDNAIDLLVIGGDQRYQSGWRCAGKLCGRPPWRGVVLYFEYASDRDRLWGRVSHLAALVETQGQPGPLVRAVLHRLGRSSTACHARHQAFQRR